MLKRSLREGMGVVYIIVDTDFSIIKDRFEKRGDEIVENVEELESEYNDWNSYYEENEWLNNNIKVKKVRDWKECISYLNWLENNVSDNRSFSFGRSNNEMEKRYREYERWSELKKKDCVMYFGKY
jgi:oligoribonuclease (3'-5' exoribonuclease)